MTIGKMLRIKPNKLKKGDIVAVVSPSSGLPAIYPAVFELGLSRLKEEFGLIPKEYFTTRARNAAPEARARDLMNAYKDPEVKAVFASIGGEDEILVLKHLKPHIFTDHPKAFFGISDNTNFSLYLWNLGITSYYGGHIMSEFSMDDKVHPFSKYYLDYAIFKQGEVRLLQSSEFTDIDLDWNDERELDKRAPYQKNAEGWFWDTQGRNADGNLWGGCLEVIDWQLAVGKYLPNPELLNETVLCIETSEEMPSPIAVSRMIRNLGERGFLERFSGMIVGRPKSWFIGGEKPDALTRAEFRKAQREAILRVFRQYNSSAPIVFGLDFGHTLPKITLPIGNRCVIDVNAREISVEY